MDFVINSDEDIRKRALNFKKSEDFDKILRICRLYRRVDFTIVLVSGCFDLYHSGHVVYLQEAAQYGDGLIVGINSDSSVKKMKGPDRPIQDEQTRAVVVAAHRFVTATIIFDEDMELINTIRPNVYICSVTSAVSPLDDGRGALLSRIGAKIVVIPSRVSIHTTDIIRRSQAIC